MAIIAGRSKMAGCWLRTICEIPRVQRLVSDWLNSEHAAFMNLPLALKQSFSNRVRPVGSTREFSAIEAGKRARRLPQLNNSCKIFSRNRTILLIRNRNLYQEVVTAVLNISRLLDPRNLESVLWEDSISMFRMYPILIRLSIKGSSNISALY